MARVVVIAGEASGDRLGASFIRSARALDPNLVVEGIAGPEMRAAGCDAWFDSQDLAVMGLVEVLRHLPRILRIKRSVERRLLENPPDVLLGIDAPDFNLRVEKKARRAGILTAHYVCPSVWAWRESRVKVLREACDLILCLLPFEPAFLARHRIDGEFVGHPLADEIPSEPDQAEARRRLGLGQGPVVTIMPGSRASEVERIGPCLAQAAEWLAVKNPKISFVVPVASGDLRDAVDSQVESLAPSARVLIIDGDAHTAIAACDAALVVSGTAALEVMLSKRPMVVAYKMASVSYYIARTLIALGLMRGDYFSLPNLLAGRSLVPELIQGEATPAALGQEINGLLQPSPHRDELVATFGEMQAQLRCGAGERAARAVLQLAGHSDKSSLDEESGLPS